MLIEKCLHVMSDMGATEKPMTSQTLGSVLTQLEAKLYSPDYPSILAILDSLLERWEAEGCEPGEAGVLSGGEYRALCLAARQESLLTSPVGDFLVLDGWLQRWVMEQRGWRHFVGARVG